MLCMVLNKTPYPTSFSQLYSRKEYQLLLGAKLGWISVPSSEIQDSSALTLQKPEISFDLMGH